MVWARSFAITLALALLTIQSIESPTMTAAPAPIAVPPQKTIQAVIHSHYLSLSR
jgi:hypothetical protein